MTVSSIVYSSQFYKMLTTRFGAWENDVKIFDFISLFVWPAKFEWCAKTFETHSKMCEKYFAF